MASNPAMKKLLKNKKAWANAKKKRDEQGDFERLPDGKYICKLIGAELGESQNSGRTQVVWEYVVKEGDSSGETIKKFDGMETEENLTWFQRELVRLGKDPDIDIEKIEEVLAELVEEGPMVRLKLVTKGEYQNVRIDKLISATGDEDGGEEPEAEEPEESEPEEEEAEEAEEPEEAEAEEEAEIEIGKQVSLKHKGKTVKGTVKKIDAKAKKATVKVGKELLIAKLDALTLEDDGDDE